MLEIKKLSLKFDKQFIFRDLNICLAEGEILLVCGDSGTGKTSFLNCLNGIIPEYISGVVSGDIHTPTTPAMLIQNPHTSTFADNVIEEISFMFENKNIPPDDIFNIVYPLTKKYKINKIIFNNLKTISAGQRQKTALISCLTQESSVIIMDEPFTLLDNAGKKILLDGIIELKKSGRIIIISEHNISYIEDIFDKILYFRNDNSYTICSRKDFKRDVVDFKKNIRTQNSFIKKKIINKKENELLSISDLSYEISDKRLFENVNFNVYASNIIGICGKNGCGKTTLLKIIAGIFLISTGKIIKNGNVCYIDQDPDKLLYADTVENEINFNNKYSKNDVDYVLENLGIEHLKNRNPFQLSIGEKHRVALAAGIISNPTILLIDEPASGLDIGNIKKYFSYINNFLINEMKAVIIALTDFQLAEHFCSKIYEIKNNNILEVK